MSHEEKPPLGIMPLYMHNSYRFTELIAAIRRYLDAGKMIPVEWLKEFNQLAVWLEEADYQKENGTPFDAVRVEQKFDPSLSDNECDVIVRAILRWRNDILKEKMYVPEEDNAVFDSIQVKLAAYRLARKLSI
jgi:hypothetical protein